MAQSVGFGSTLRSAPSYLVLMKQSIDARMESLYFTMVLQSTSMKDRACGGNLPPAFRYQIIEVLDGLADIKSEVK
jgi:hypothetical protein